MDNFRHNAFINTLWSAFERLGSQVLQFITVIVLARILTPADFGLIGLLTIFMALARVFIDSGLGTALIRKKNVSDKDYSTVFVFNIIAGTCIYILLFFSAQLIADFFHDKRLVLLTRIISLNFLIGAFYSIYVTILTKKMDFKKQTKVSIYSTIFAGIVAISSAYLGLGVWALVFQTLSYSIISSLLYWTSKEWKPKIEFCYKSFRNLFGFSSRILLSTLIDTMFQNIYNVIIGKYFNVVSLGYYTQAKKIQETPSLTINNIVQRVSFPLFSTLQNNERRLKLGQKKTTKLLAFILFPIMFWLFATSDPLVEFILTDKWINSIQYLKPLCIVGILNPLQSLNLNILNVKGRSDVFLKLEIVRKTIIILFIFLGIKWGVLGLVRSYVVASFINYIIVVVICGSFLNYKLKEQILDILPYLLISLFMSITTQVFYLCDLSNLYTLIFQVILGSVVYLLLSYVFKLEAFNEILNLIKPNND